MKISSNLYVKFIPFIFSLCFVSSGAQGATPSLEEIWQLVQSQQAQIDQLQRELTSSQRRLEDAQAKLRVQNETQAIRITQTETTIEDTVSAIEYAIESGTVGEAPSPIGGYGEMHYSNLDSKEEIDFHRFVLFFSNQFTEKLAFYSELEVEHAIAGEGKVGEVEVEQAFVQYDYADGHRVKAGIFLVPAGMLNETHEPDTFYGTERNEIEKNIIPTTWWEAGLALDGEFAPGWRYDLAVHSGLRLDTDNAKASKRSSIRSARQSAGNAVAENLAYTARIRFSGIAGLQWNATFQYQSDLTQNDVDLIGIDAINATLFETSLSFQRGGFGLKALYARWDIDNEVELLNLGSDEQIGWYVEPSYRYGKLGVFTRFSQYDLTAGSSTTSNEQQQFDLGFNYWLHENVVLKANYQVQDNDNGNENDGFNLGVGYSF